ncbi:MAG: hypothetical protein LBI62_09025 [Candidatus Accumulibacter sp.]|jgi:hypothetical protein|nr:hypothetical protein [Accumulibacter sp.]
MPLIHLTLFAPGLLRPETEYDAQNEPACPALALLLGRGHSSECPPQATEAALMTLFGYATNTACATLRLRGESDVPTDAATARWIAADPVHLHPDGESLILVDDDTLPLAPEEAAALVDALNDHFADLGAFYAASPERWYLRQATDILANLDAPPLSAVAGRHLEQLPRGMMENMKILNLLNEIQSFLHTSPINRQREGNGRKPINSLWFWGDGTPAPTTTISPEFDLVLGADTLTRGLARAAGLPARPLPEDADALLADIAPGTRALLVFDTLEKTTHHENDADYRQILTALETRWFAPVWRALTDGRVGRLRLVAPNVRMKTLVRDAGRAATWRFWRRPQTLAETARTLTVPVGEAA